MPNENPVGPSVHLGVEVLEARTVPASFGTNSGLSLAVGDIDPTTAGPEFITGTGPGTTALVRVYDSSGRLKYTFQPFNDLTVGVYVAVGDVNFDGQLDIVCSTAAGTTGRVRVYEFRSLTSLPPTQAQPIPLADFTPFGPAYNGGVQIAVGHVAGDRTQEIIVGMESGGSTVKVFANQASSGGSKFFQIRSFDAFKAGYVGGVSVTTGNVDPTIVPTVANPVPNFDEVIIGKSANAPVVKIYGVDQPALVMRAKYFAFDPNVQANRIGIQVVAGNTDGVAGAEIYAVQRNSTLVRIFNGITGVPVGEFTVAYPRTYTRNINMTILNATDVNVIPAIPLVPTNLYVVASEILPFNLPKYEQIPIVFPGKAGSPAGLNGSRAAP